MSFGPGFLPCPLEGTTNTSNEGHLSSGIDTIITHGLSWFDILEFDCIKTNPDDSPFFDFEVTNKTSYDMQYVSSILYYDLDDDNDVSIIKPSINIISDPLTMICPEFVDPTSQYLYALDLHLQTTQSNCSSYYNSSQSREFEQLCAHMDAGSMASTTNRLDFMSNFQLLHGPTTTL